MGRVRTVNHLYRAEVMPFIVGAERVLFGTYLAMTDVMWVGPDQQTTLNTNMK